MDGSFSHLPTFTPATPFPSKPRRRPSSTVFFFVSSLATLLPSVTTFETPTIPTDQLTCRPKGLIQDTSCNYETIDEVNRKLKSELSLAVQLPIFRYHKVDLYRQCPFWEEDGLCGNQACAVNELDQDDVPAYWKTPELGNLKTTDTQELPINLSDKCVVKEQDYCVLDDYNGVPSNGVYVDLLANPERFTGYAGKSAQRVWRAIYEENCFDVVAQPKESPFGVPPVSPLAGLGPEGRQDGDDPSKATCLEKRVYYKLLSGLHTSISMHICDEYLDPATGRWVPNLQCYLNRIGLHPERLENLYFAYTLMLRALSRSASHLKSAEVELCTGDKTADRRTREVMDKLISTAHSYPVTFDETSMFKAGASKESNLKEEFKSHFRNVSRIMDCVGCDKCRLWGKLQVMGLGTALKLLFEYEDGVSADSDFHLTRPELIAFINTLNRLSESLDAVEKFRRLWQRRSNEGTLPRAVIDEKLDALASGRAARAIALNPGLGPRVESSWHGATPVIKPTPQPDQDQMDRPVKSVTLELHRTQPPTPPASTSPTPPVLSQITPAPAAMTYSASRNRSDTKAGGVLTQQVDLGTFVRPAGRLLKLLTSRCKESVAVCSHWFVGLINQMKFSAFHISSNRGHHHEDLGRPSDREKEL